MSLIIRAEEFATEAHFFIGHKRKYTDEDYIVHPRNVAYLVQMVGGTDAMIAAAFLHDVLEDVWPHAPQYNEDAILREFGSQVLYLVKCLTDVSMPADGNREKRKKIDREHTAMASPDAKTIKLADLIDNSMTITQYDPGFAKAYLAEKRLLLPHLIDGNKELWCIANQILIRNGYAI